MKIIKKIIYIALVIVLFTVLPVVVFTFITSKTTAFGIQSFVVLSGSMQPTIPVGSVIYTQRQPVYQKGDIVAFKSGDITVSHRIVNARGNGTYQTKGDANNTPDSKTITNSDVLGREIFFLPYIGRAVALLKTPMGFFPIIVFPITVFIVLELWNLKKEIEKEVEKKLQKKMEII